jgi:putative oxidoreductase
MKGNGFLALLGRVCLSVIFVTSAWSKMSGWSGNVAYIATRHIENPWLVNVMIGGALVVELVGALCLLTGYRAAQAALVMAVYLAAVTVIFHNFWAFTGMVRGANFMHFQKNLGILGGLLMVAALGPGRLALGKRADA